MGATLSSLFPPAPGFTEENVPDLSGRVYLVTGASAGVGRELAALLYSRNARVWVAARSRERADAAMAGIRAAHPHAEGELLFVRVDLADLATVRPAVDEFLARENRLDVLWNNAGLMSAMWTPTVPTTAQGLEMQLGVNCVAAFLLTRLLTPILVATVVAADTPADSVRVVWVGSSATEMSPYRDGVPMASVAAHTEFSTLPLVRYFVSKSGAYLYAAEFARRHRADGIVSVALNPGNLDSELWRELPAAMHWVLRTLVLHPAVKGAYTELYAGLAPDVTLEQSGGWIVPWGRMHPIKESMRRAGASEAEGGTGVAARFWDWSEKQVEAFC